MYITRCTFILGLILTILLDPISARVNTSSSYNYPTSNGLSGNGNGGGYPVAGQNLNNYTRPPSYPPTISTNTYPPVYSHPGYPSPAGGNTYAPVPTRNYYPAGNANYPKPNGNAGYSGSGGSFSYPPSTGVYPQPTNRPATNQQAYQPYQGTFTTPRNNITFGNNSYNRTSPGGYNKVSSTVIKQHTTTSTSGNLSGGGSGYPKQTSTVYHRRYYYKPPSKISYIPRKGGAPVSYPVYRGELPTYVYDYKESNSKYGSLLAGLALMNLGSLAANAARTGQTSNNFGNQISNNYIPQLGEICKFAIKNADTQYEEYTIDCQLMSSYILQGIQAVNSGQVSNITNNYNKDVYISRGDANITPNPQQIMLPNGTIVYAQGAYEKSQFSQTTNEAIGYFHYDMLPNGTLVLNGILPTGSRTPNIVQPRNALDEKGDHLKVTKEMACFVIRHTQLWTMRKAVPCRLLQLYSDASLRSVNSAKRNGPMFTIIAAIFTVLSYKLTTNL